MVPGHSYRKALWRADNESTNPGPGRGRHVSYVPDTRQEAALGEALGNQHPPDCPVGQRMSRIHCGGMSENSDRRIAGKVEYCRIVLILKRRTNEMSIPKSACPRPQAQSEMSRYIASRTVQR
jgi:hypothetical protein